MPIEQIYTSQTEDVKPLISFIITTYNLPTELLRECMESVISLSLRPTDMEIIVVDDGSDTPVISDLSDYQDDIIYIRQRNKGPSAARNIGLAIASGKYIQFIDGDDYIIKAPYEHCLDIVRYENPDIVLFNMISSGKPNIPFVYGKPMTGSKYMRDNNLKVAPWGYVFRKKLLLDLRFTEGLIHEDEEFTPLLILRAERLFATSADAYYYRKREGSITNNKDKDHIIKRLTDTETIILKLQHTAATLPIGDRCALERRVAQLTMDYLYNIIHVTHNAKTLEETVKRLSTHALFPLPKRDYTKKYTMFRQLVNTKIGRKLLLILIK